MAKYLEILFRFRFRFAVLLIVVPAVVGAVTILMSPEYKAIAYLWVDDPTFFGGVTPTGWSQYLTPAQNESDSLAQLASTRAFGNDLYNALGDPIPDPAQRLDAVKNAHVQVIATSSHMILITATCEEKPVCALLVNKSVDVLRTEQIADERENAKAGQAYLTVRLQQARTDQTTAEDALRRYIVTHPGANVNNVNADPTAITDPDLSRLALAVQQARSRVTDLQNQVDRNNEIVSASTAVIQTLPRIIDPPILTRGFPIGDGNPLKKGAMYGGGALAVGVLYLLLLGFLDKTLRDPREIEHRFRVPVVTTIPELLPSERF